MSSSPPPPAPQPEPWMVEAAREWFAEPRTIWNSLYTGSVRDSALASIDIGAARLAECFARHRPAREEIDALAQTFDDIAECAYEDARQASAEGESAMDLLAMARHRAWTEAGKMLRDRLRAAPAGEATADVCSCGGNDFIGHGPTCKEAT
jgi:hypothetical protein